MPSKTDPLIDSELKACGVSLDELKAQATADTFQDERCQRAWFAIRDLITE